MMATMTKKHDGFDRWTYLGGWSLFLKIPIMEDCIYLYILELWTGGGIIVVQSLTGLSWDVRILQSNTLCLASN
jgi:hypothetical protein